MFVLKLDENNTIWVGLIISLLIHILIFSFSGVTLIQHVQYSVQSSFQTVEVSLQEVSETSDARPAKGGEAISKQSPASHNIKFASHALSGVRIKANPNYFQNLAPEYPELARQMRQEGLVMLSVDVNKNGEAVKVDIIKSSGFRMLDQAAFKAVSHWKFHPGSIGNIPIESTVTVPIKFRLEK